MVDVVLKDIWRHQTNSSKPMAGEICMMFSEDYLYTLPIVWSRELFGDEFENGHCENVQWLDQLACASNLGSI